MMSSIPALQPTQLDLGDKGHLRRLPAASLRGRSKERGLGNHRRLSRQVRAPALEVNGRTGPQNGWPRRNGLHHELPADGLPKKGSGARYQCLRCRCLERAYSVKRDVGCAEWRSPEISRFHPGEVGWAFELSWVCRPELSAESILSCS